MTAQRKFDVVFAKAGDTDKACSKKELELSARCACVQDGGDGGGCRADCEQDGARGAAGGEDRTFRAHTEDASLSGQRLQIQRKGLIVDTGASSHITNDKSKFKSFDSTFKPKKHSMELADGKRTVGVAQGRGDAQVCLTNSEVRRCAVT